MAAIKIDEQHEEETSNEATPLWPKVNQYLSNFDDDHTESGLLEE